jgi:hypothetical protein
MIKQASSMKVRDFKSLINENNIPTGAKSVGGGTVLVYMSGLTNYYISDSPMLRKILWTYRLEP